MNPTILTFTEYTLIEVVEYFNEKMEEPAMRSELFVAGDTLLVDVIEEKDNLLFVQFLPDGEMANIPVNIVEQCDASESGGRSILDRACVW